MFEALKSASTDEKERFVAAVMKIDEAETALEAGDTAGGMALYRAAIALCPPCEFRGNYRVVLGGLLFDQGEAAAAEREFRAAVDEECSFPYEALRRLAFARAAQGDFAAAVAAMHQAATTGEDFAFAAQAMVTFGLALGRMDEVVRVAEDGPELADCEPEFRRRLALARAELALLAGDQIGMRAALDAAAAFRAGDNAQMDLEEALRLATLDRIAGRQDLRAEVCAAFDEAPQNWVVIAWEIMHGRVGPSALIACLANDPWGQRAENLAQYHRLAGLLAEQAGDVTAARRHYETARIEPFTQWCIDYHLAGFGLARLEGVA